MLLTIIRVTVMPTMMTIATMGMVLVMMLTSDGDHDGVDVRIHVDDGDDEK